MVVLGSLALCHFSTLLQKRVNPVSSLYQITSDMHLFHSASKCSVV